MSIVDKYIKVSSYYMKKFIDLNYDIKEIDGHKYVCQLDIFNAVLPTSTLKLECECDECHTVFIRQIASIHNMQKYDGKVRCEKCLRKYISEHCKDEILSKMKETNRKKYGTDMPSQSESIKNKMKATCLAKYGTEWGAQSESIKQKMKGTCKQKYGTEWAMQSQTVQQKSKQTCMQKYGVEFASSSEQSKNNKKRTNMKKYGVDCPLRLEEIKQKRYKTNLEKYGHKNALQNDQVKQKQRKTMYINGTVPTSKQQLHLHELFGGELNYPVSFYNIDIALLQEKIAIEYNGGGHGLTYKLKGGITKEAYNKLEITRTHRLYKEGWKLITFIARQDKLLEDNILLRLLEYGKNYLLNTDHHWITFDLDNNLVTCSMKSIKIDEIC